MLVEIVDNWCEIHQEVITRLSSIITVDGIVIRQDMCYKSGPLINPEHFKTFMLPRLGELIQVAPRCGIECVTVDSDGDVREMIPLWLEAGVNALMPFEVQAGMDVVKIGEEFGDTFCMMGGIDKRALARDLKSIEKESTRVVPCFINSGRYIPHLDHLVPDNVSFENFTHHRQLLKQYERGFSATLLAGGS